MKKVLLATCCLFNTIILLAQNDPKTTEVWEPVPKVITPGKTPQDPPSDAIILFNGKDLSSWADSNGKSTAKWKVENDAVTVTKGQGDIHTKQAFGDCQLHIEWRTPSEVIGESQGRGNSGIFLMGHYEVQVLDNYNNRTYSNGQAGSIYKQYIPLANVCKPPGEWQTYDIIFTAPRFSDNGMKNMPQKNHCVCRIMVILSATEISG